jgi:hypothetical protein
VGAQERGHRLRDPAQQRALLAGLGLFTRLDLFPLLDHLARRIDPLGPRKHVRVAADQLLADMAERVGHREPPFVGLNLRQEDSLE